MKENQAGAVLTVRCGAFARNWRKLKQAVGSVDCGAVMKANAYGLGVEKPTQALINEGCRTFFTAYGFEAEKIRALSDEVSLFVLHGFFAGEEQNFIEKRLIPVLNTPEQLRLWNDFAQKTGRQLPCAVHVDTGMTRMGLTKEQLFSLTSENFQSLRLVLLMSHLACADDVNADEMNKKQLKRFQTAKDYLKSIVSNDFQCSLSASFGIFLGPEYHFDLVRPGRGLYGFMDGFEPVFSLKARILQIQKVKAYRPIGYGSTDCLKKDGKLATIALGYADGYRRSFSKGGFVVINGKKAPIVGRISMDLTTLDVSDFSDDELNKAVFAEIFGPNVDLAEAAKIAGTIDYELLTGLGKRFFVCYED